MRIGREEKEPTLIGQKRNVFPFKKTFHHQGNRNVPQIIRLESANSLGSDLIRLSRGQGLCISPLRGQRMLAIQHLPCNRLQIIEPLFVRSL